MDDPINALDPEGLEGKSWCQRFFHKLLPGEKLAEGLDEQQDLNKTTNEGWEKAMDNMDKAVGGSATEFLDSIDDHLENLNNSVVRGGLKRTKEGLDTIYTPPLPPLKWEKK